MRIKKFVGVILTFLMLAFLAGCASAPEQELVDTKAALSSAADAEANRYLPEQYNAAKDTLDAAVAEIEAQNAKFALLRSYDRSRQLLATAKQLAETAQGAVAAKKEEVRMEAEALTQQVKAAMEDATKKMKKAPKGKEGKTVLMAMQNDLKVIETELTAAQELYTKGDFLGSRDKVQSLLDQVNGINNELDQAIAKKAKISGRK